MNTSHLDTTRFESGPFIITVVGNIGSGKSSVIQSLAKSLAAKSIPHVALEEPVDMWTYPYNFLKETEQTTNFKPIGQGYIFCTLMNKFIPLRNFDGIVLIERGVINGVYEFSRDETNPLVLHFYRELARFEREAGVNLIIDIQTSIQSCVHRIKSRSRDGELEEISITPYLTKLDTNHREFMNLCQYLCKEKVLVFDNEQDISTQQESINELADNIINLYSAYLHRDRTVQSNRLQD